MKRSCPVSLANARIVVTLVWVCLAMQVCGALLTPTLYDGSFATPRSGLGRIQSLWPLPSGKIIVGGEFVPNSYERRGGIARLLEDGRVDMSFVSPFKTGSRVSRIDGQVSSGSFLVGGDLFVLDGQGSYTGDHRNLVRMAADGGIDPEFKLDSRLRTISDPFVATVNGGVLGVATFSSNVFSATAVVRLNPNGALDTSFQPFFFQGMLQAILELPSREVILAGGFSRTPTAGGQRIVRLSPDGTLDPDFVLSSGFSASPTALAVGESGTLYVGAQIDRSSVNSEAPTTQLLITKLLRDGEIDRRWTEILDNDDSFPWRIGRVAAIHVDGEGKVWVGGSFHDITAWPVPVKRAGVILINRWGQLERSLLATAPNLAPSSPDFPEYSVNTIAAPKPGTLLIGGRFLELDASTGPDLVRVWTDPSRPSVRFAARRGVAARALGQFDLEILRAGNLDAPLSMNLLFTNRIAELGKHYQPSAKTIHFQPGQDRLTTPVFILSTPPPGGLPDNTAFEVFLSPIASGVAVGAPASEEVQILEDFGEVAISWPNGVVSEAQGQLQISVQRTLALDQELSVAYSVLPGNARPGRDFHLEPGRITFGPNERYGNIPIEIFNNGVTDGDRDFRIRLSDPTPGLRLGAVQESYVVIQDNDLGVRFENRSYAFSETDFEAQVNVTLNGDTPFPVEIRYWTEDGDALGGSDYRPVSGVLRFGDGNVHKTISVPLLRDAVTETTESFVLRLEVIEGDVKNLTDKTVVLLRDAYTPPTLQRLEMVGFESDGRADIDLRDIAPLGTPSVDLEFITEPGSALRLEDYTPSHGSITVPAYPASLSIPLVNDSRWENDEVFDLVLKPRPGTAPSQETRMHMRIFDDDRSGGITRLDASSRDFYAGLSQVVGWNADRWLGISADGALRSFKSDGAIDPLFKTDLNPQGSLIRTSASKVWLFSRTGNPSIPLTRQFETFRLLNTGDSDPSFRSSLFPRATLLDVVVSPDDEAWVAYLQHDYLMESEQSLTTPHLTKLDASGQLLAHQEVDAARLRVSIPELSSEALELRISALALQQDGRLLVGGSVFPQQGYLGVACVIRLNRDGSRDLNFRSVPLGSLNPYLANLVIAPAADGSIFVGGSSLGQGDSGRKGIVKLADDGRVQTDFDFPLKPSLGVSQIWLQNDGMILVAGNLRLLDEYRTRMLVRCFPDGSVDHSFDCSLEADDFAPPSVARLGENYVIAAAFGATRVRIDPAVRSVVRSEIKDVRVSVLEPEAKLVLLREGPSKDRIVVELEVLDELVFGQEHFELPSRVEFAPGESRQEVRWRLPRGTGCLEPRNYRFRLKAAPTATWSPRDPQYSITVVDATSLRQKPGSRVVEMDLSAPQGMLRGNDGSLYLWSEDGLRRRGGLVTFLIRLHPDGSIDESFHTTIAPSRSLDSREDRLVALTPEQELLVLVGGYGTQPSWRKLRRDGEEDTSFAGPQALRDRMLWPCSIFVADDGMIYLGVCSEGFQRNSGLVRVLPDGRVDDTFQAPVLFGKYPRVEARLADGRLMVVGDFQRAGTVACSGLLRLMPDGKVDPSFNLSYPESGVSFHSSSLVIEPHGTMIGAGEFSDSRGIGGEGLLRLGGDGALREYGAEFSPSGSRTLTLHSWTENRLLVSGYSFPGSISIVEPDLSARRMVNPLLPIEGEPFQPTQVLTVNPDGSFWAMEASYPQDGSAIRVRLACLQEPQEGDWERIVRDAHLVRLWARSEKGHEYELQFSGELVSWQAIGRKSADSCRLAWEVETDPKLSPGFFRLLRRL